MDITSVTYLFFVILTMTIYWKISYKFRWYLLLVISLLFYFVNTKSYTFIYLFISVMTVYIATNYFENERVSKKTKKIILICTISINIGILSVLKYSNLLIVTINFIGKKQISLVSFYSSMGISFYTLQIISYLLDYYWGATESEKNPCKLLLFTCYFPLMISGPISKHQLLGHQFYEEHEFDYGQITSALRRIGWGFAKKLVVADNLAPIVILMFERTDVYTGVWVMVAAMLFSIELYFDFSGCMDIVIGTAACFGIELQENFNAPFFSNTIQEFWKRWHITLGMWFKCYVMYPILKSGMVLRLSERCMRKWGKGGKKVTAYVSMFIVWNLIGLWHGNSWKFIIGESWWFWSVITLGQVFKPKLERLKSILRIKESSIIWQLFQKIRTFILFSVGMIFFNSSDLRAALHMIRSILIRPDMRKAVYILNRDATGNYYKKMTLLVVILIILIQIYIDFKIYSDKNICQKFIVSKPKLIRWGIYFGLVFTIIVFGVFGQSTFIYYGF